MIRLFMDNSLFFSFDEGENPENYSLRSMKLSEEVNTLSHLSITILFNHPRISSIRVKKSTFVLTDDQTCLFIGKVLSISKSMSSEVQIEIEDLLGCLRDQIVPGYAYTVRSGKEYRWEVDGLSYENVYSYNDTLYDLRNYLKPGSREGYNSNYTIPACNVLVDLENIPSSASEWDETSIEPINFEPTSALEGDSTNIAAFKDALSILYNDINAEGGGVVYTKCLGRLTGVSTTNVKYVIDSYELHYDIRPKLMNKKRNSDGKLTNVDYSWPSTFQFGYNLLDFELEPAVSDPTSAIAPSGNYKIPGEDQTRLVMLDNGYTTNGNVSQPDAFSKYGLVVKPLDFGYIGEFNIYRDAQNKLYSLTTKFLNERLGAFGDRITITGIAPYYLGLEGFHIALRDLVHIVSSPHSLNMIDYCLSKDIDFFDHSKDRYVVGPFIPSNYLEYKSTNVQQQNVEQIIANGSTYRRETEGLYTDSSYVSGVRRI